MQEYHGSELNKSLVEQVVEKIKKRKSIETDARRSMSKSFYRTPLNESIQNTSNKYLSMSRNSNPFKARNKSMMTNTPLIRDQIMCSESFKNIY